MRLEPKVTNWHADAPPAYRDRPIFFEKPLVVAPVLLAIDFFLVIMHFVATTAPPPFDALTVWFDLDGESTIAAWFASSQLLISGLLLYVAGTYGGEARSQSLLYIVVGLGFVFLSADEAAGIHEKITTFTVKHASVPRFEGDHGVWIFVYATVGAVLMVAMRRSLYAAWLYQRTPASLVALGFAIMVAGAVFIEILGYHGLMTDNFQVVTEELLEMLGGSLIVCGALILFTRIVRLGRNRRPAPEPGAPDAS